MKSICRDELEVILEAHLDDAEFLLGESAEKFKQMKAQKYGHKEDLEDFLEEIDDFMPRVTKQTHGDGYNVAIICLEYHDKDGSGDPEDANHQKKIFKKLIAAAKSCNVYVRRVWHYDGDLYCAVICPGEGGRHRITDKHLKDADKNSGKGIVSRTKKEREEIQKKKERAEKDKNNEKLRAKLKARLGTDDPEVYRYRQYNNSEVKKKGQRAPLPK